MNNPLDEMMGFTTPTDIEVHRVEKHFDELTYAVSSALKTIKYCEDDVVVGEVERISNQLSWFEDDFHKLVAAYEDVLYLVEAYRELVEERLSSDEVFDLNAIKVKQRFMLAR